jgi:DNA-binding response OmpR family regulator
MLATVDDDPASRTLTGGNRTRMTAIKVAIFNAHVDTVAMLHLALQHAGFTTIDAPLREYERGTANALAFLRTHEPDAIVYDVSEPYEQTAAFCCEVQEADDPRAWVITSTNPPRTERDLRGRSEWYELIGKPYDLDNVVAAVRRAVQKTSVFRAGKP